MINFLPLIFPCLLLSVAVGTWIANHDIETRNKHVSPIVSYAAIASVLIIFSAVVGFNLLKVDRSLRWIGFVQIYLFGYFEAAIIALITLGFGFLFALLVAFWSTRIYRYILMGITLPIVILLFFITDLYQPISPLKQPSNITADNIVMQTTSYTCAPAAIATLARFTGKHPQITEKEVAVMAQTNKGGTSTLAEIRVLDQLGMQPQYEWSLTANDLLNQQQPAILHVQETVEGQKIAHAIALLQIKPEKKEIVVANPLQGKLTLEAADLKDYWNGEAIFVARVKV